MTLSKPPQTVKLWVFNPTVWVMNHSQEDVGVLKTRLLVLSSPVTLEALKSKSSEYLLLTITSKFWIWCSLCQSISQKMSAPHMFRRLKFRGVASLTDRWMSTQVAVAACCLLGFTLANWSPWTRALVGSCGTFICRNNIIKQCFY